MVWGPFASEPSEKVVKIQISCSHCRTTESVRLLCNPENPQFHKHPQSFLHALTFENHSCNTTSSFLRDMKLLVWAFQESISATLVERVLYYCDFPEGFTTKMVKFYDWQEEVLCEGGDHWGAGWKGGICQAARNLQRTLACVSPRLFTSNSNTLWLWLLSTVSGSVPRALPVSPAWILRAPRQHRSITIPITLVRKLVHEG